MAATDSELWTLLQNDISFPKFVAFVYDDNQEEANDFKAPTKNLSYSSTTVKTVTTTLYYESEDINNFPHIVCAKTART